MLKTILSAATALFYAGAPLLAEEGRFRVHSYASQVNDVDAVNSHWFETADGVVLIDAQRILPEAEQALRHLRATTAKPVTAIVVTHAHTDHYGGLPVWLAAFPDATIYMDESTRSAIADDRRGYIAARTERHGDRFAGLEALTRALANVSTVEDGDTFSLGGETLAFRQFGPSEAETTMLVSLPERGTAFIGDLVNVGVPAVPFESLDAWLEQLELLQRTYAGSALYQGHGEAPVGAEAIAAQRRFLERLRDLTKERIGDSMLDREEQEEIAFQLEAEWPFLAGVAGNTRREILAFDARLAAEQYGAEVAD